MEREQENKERDLHYAETAQRALARLSAPLHLGGNKVVSRTELHAREKENCAATTGTTE